MKYTESEPERREQIPHGVRFLSKFLVPKHLLFISNVNLHASSCKAATVCDVKSGFKSVWTEVFVLTVVAALPFAQGLIKSSSHTGDHECVKEHISRYQSRSVCLLSAGVWDVGSPVKNGSLCNWNWIDQSRIPHVVTAWSVCESLMRRGHTSVHPC